MAQAPHPRMHGLTHVTGGSDPVPGLLPPLPLDYPGRILTHPCLVHYWPADEPTGSLADRKGGWNLTAVTHTAADSSVWPQYGEPGPFPPLAAVGNYGESGLLADDHGRFSYTMPTGGLASPFTIELWLLLTDWAFRIVSGTVTPTGAGYVAVVGGLANVYIPSTGTDPHQMVAQTGSVTLVDPDDFPMLSWQHIALRHNGTTFDLFRNGTVRASAAATPQSAAGELAWLNTASVSSPEPFTGASGHLALYNCALDDATIISHSNMLADSGAGGGHTGEVPTLGDDGTVTWELPQVDVTVNGETPTPSAPMPAPLPPPVDTGPDSDDWIRDQPFTWGGPEFEVQPNKWTTIPFTTPLMERQSNVTGGSTTWFELDPDDPAAAGWVDPATPRVITIPHDMPFDIGNYSWMQICLKLEIPPVEDEVFVEGTDSRGSYRGLRVFETTHQKPLLVAYHWRGVAGEGHGGTDVFRDPTKHGGLLGDAALFALGDPGGEHIGEHGNIMIVPNSDAGYLLPGMDWLPGHAAGNPTLKKGMRLLAQVWHNASVPLTFDCTGVLPYRPHFVFVTPALRAWGPPWSDWPTAA